MDFFITVLIFVIVLFFYIHITYQYKTSEDLEIYELDYKSNNQLQETCNIKQPILFKTDVFSENEEFCERISVDSLLNHGNSYIKIKDSNDYIHDNVDSVDYFMLTVDSGYKLLDTDTRSHYYSENNQDLLDDTALSNEYTTIDKYIKPTLSVYKRYDILFGSKNTNTCLKFHTNYRYFLYVTSGKIRIKMTPWKSRRMLYPIYDYDNYEFFSPINVWNPQERYLHEMDKIKFLEFDVHEGFMLFIPSFWWYSIKFSTSDTSVATFTYNNTMNILSNLPNISLYLLQQANINKKTVKTLNLEDKQENDEKNTSL